MPKTLIYLPQQQLLRSRKIGKCTRKGIRHNKLSRICRMQPEDAKRSAELEDENERQSKTNSYLQKEAGVSLVKVSTQLAGYLLVVIPNRLAAKFHWYHRKLTPSHLGGVSRVDTIHS